jgi:hypothetical protein
MIKNDGLGRIWKEVVMTYLPAWTEENQRMINEDNNETCGLMWVPTSVWARYSQVLNLSSII